MEQIGYPRNVIIDTDMGWDDIIAILLLMKNPNIKICGITVTGCGETHLDNGVALAQSILALGNINAPVCRGAFEPSVYAHQFPESFRTMMDIVCDLRKNLPEPLQPLDTRMAWDFIRDELEREEYQITLLSLGGLTNIARVLDMSPRPELENIERIFIMGGAIDVDGNVAALNNSKPEFNQGPEYESNYYAEWNIFLDPLAAQKVLDSNIPITLVPLDACDYVLLSPDYAEMVVAKDPVAEFLKQLLERKNGGICKEPIPLPIFDPLAALIMTGDLRPERFRRVGIDVVIDETAQYNQCGRTEENPGKKPEITYVAQISEHNFKAVFAKHANAPMYAPPPSDKLWKVGQFLFPGVEIQDFCGTYEVFAGARHESGDPAFDVFSFAVSPGIVPAFAGPPPAGHKFQSSIGLTPDFVLENVPHMDVIVIVGGQGIDELSESITPESKLSEWFREKASKARYVVTICSGAIFASKAGLMKSIHVTTHHTRFEQLQKISDAFKLGLTVMDTRNGRNFVQDSTSNVISSGGVHCGLAAAVHVVGLFLGSSCQETLAWDVMEYNMPVGSVYSPDGFPHSREMNPEEFILGFSHLNVIMRDVKMMDEATEFYNRVLGFRQAWSLWLPDEAAKRFGVDAGVGEECRVMVRFLEHPNARIFLELMLYDYPKGNPEIQFHKTNDVGGIRHVALEVTDAVAVYNWLSKQDGVTLLAPDPPSLLAPDPQTFFYFIDPYGVQWEMEQGRPMRRAVLGIVG